MTELKQNMERELDFRLTQLYRELYENEKRMKRLNDKEERLDKLRSKKRTREDTDSSASKRLKSSVSVVNQAPEQTETPPTPQSTEKRRTQSLSGEDKTRNKRLLSSLLVGTLKTFKKESLKEEESGVVQKRKEVETQIENKVTSENQKLLESDAQKVKDDKDRLIQESNEIKENIKQKENELLKWKSDRHETQLSFFLKTNAKPVIYFMPAVIDQWTEKHLGTKKPEVKPIEVKKEKSDDDRAKDNEDSKQEPSKGSDESQKKNNNEGDDDVEVEEIAGEKEDEEIANKNNEEDGKPR
eukprot:TRINITY_DN12005_c0_g1_i1.p1 TRINITY_DN12005_c0_g1~~TRINITY_DN12005_c0_g1_i1.p1  ORF type:complete len:299 (-),score=83.41 TRINITY_DN12005_c0_g1_i1:39-935(-)